MITGYAFLYKQDNRRLDITLKTYSGNVLTSQTVYGLPSPGVDQYFSCDRDYSHTGFQAVFKDLDPHEEYEIVVNFGWLMNYDTGVYITGERLHYCRDNKLLVPEGLNEITENGNLRVYRPDYHCWVYQVGSNLYWIADKDFNFEDDGTTYIQFQLHTTQTDNLPQKRLKNLSFIIFSTKNYTNNKFSA